MESAGRDSSTNSGGGECVPMRRGGEGSAATQTRAAKRLANEKKFGSWEELPDGGRCYFYTVQGRHGWWARYVKEVDAFENTVRFYQEIYDDQGRLVEVHEKYPLDKGHVRVGGQIHEGDTQRCGSDA